MVIKGTNIIGILPGRHWGSNKDRLYVLGAHWDTVPNSVGFDDNSSGVAAVLEVARMLSSSKCDREFSLIFVLFDLEELGSLGSLYFIREYLLPFVLKPFGFPEFGGAYILDCIMNYNSTANTQTLPEDWSLILPHVHDRLMKDNFKGDFQTVVYRRFVDRHLADLFAHEWAVLNDEPETDKFDIEHFDLNLPATMPDTRTLTFHINFLRSDHARFWYMNDSRLPETFGSVLITDTGR